MKKTMLILVSSFVLFFSGCGSDSENKIKKPPIKIYTQTEIRMNTLLRDPVEIPYVNIVSTTDEVIIENMIVNNGNCQMSSYDQRMFPKTLKYGENIKIWYTSDCNVLRVEVVTNYGNWTIEY